MSARPDPRFWAGRKVLVTGHTGFKGAWLTRMLGRLGAEVTGLALAPAGSTNLYELAGPQPWLSSYIMDINDAAGVQLLVSAVRPELVLHLAAQALVRPSYEAPKATFATNVMGTIHLMEALRASPGLKALLVVTTDKVYANPETGQAFREADALGGHDPYSASKAACEIAVASWRQSFFAAAGVAVATARAGNVIGGGDFAENRIIPDIFRAFQQGATLTLRHPQATRPWQHVLDGLNGYLLYAEALAQQRAVPAALNFGPSGAPLAVARVVEAMQGALGATPGWQQAKGPQVHEAGLLALDSHAAHAALGWRDQFDSATAIARTAAWYAAFARGGDMRAYGEAELREFMGL
ncbi:MAG: CDP-glucose 4,6-dehydratase [Hyphomicrobiales bacterium]|nr:CDP-glucose 4,6-dehydratase [Hyphomicrobiales bacterium]